LLLSVGCSSPSQTAAAPDAAVDSAHCMGFGCVDAGDIDATIWERARNRLDGCTGNECHNMGAGGLLILVGNETEFLFQPSSERPALWRVRPGDPQNSYLYLKVLGDGGIDGGRMPLGGPYNPNDVQLFYDWILDGAPDH
jgi:hypothetical protein